ncbi:MAG: rssA [Mucilaginibacter sp.]|nr:rssA [Mucilaginibacter sp.]
MKQKVALVLSGGGARGIAHIGVIEALEKQGFKITSISGTSMGALVGGVYALGKIGIYKDWLCTLDKMKVFSLIDFNLKGQGLVKGDKLFGKMRELVADANIEDLKIPYCAVAADIINKKEVVFTEGSVLDAVRASIAIPTVLTPVRTENGLLVDGGVINNLPINHVKRTPGDILIAVNVNAMIPFDKPAIIKNETVSKLSAYQEKIKEFYSHLYKINPVGHEEKFGYFDVINKTLNLMTHHTTQMALERYSPDILINISQDCCGTYDFYKAEEIIETGRRAANKSLAGYDSKVINIERKVGNAQ